MFPWSFMLFAFFSCSSSSMVSVVSFTSIHNSNPRSSCVLKQRSDLNFNTVNDLHDDIPERAILDQFTYSYESSLFLEISERYGAAYVLCINLPFRSVLQYQVRWNIVLFRQFSDQRWSIVWITSERQIVVRIAARLLSAGFSVAAHRSAGRQQAVR